MNSPDPIIFRELPVIQKIIHDETWLEGERRGCYVSPNDQAVRARVCEIVLRVGKELRESLAAALARESLTSSSAPTSSPYSSEAA